MHTARFGERLPRLQIQFRISRSFRPRNLANLGSKIRFWIRRKEHTLNVNDAFFNSFARPLRLYVTRPLIDMRYTQTKCSKRANRKIELIS